ncbi:uncharacterized protein N7496_005747 [Penicillium cataractarum]|uniref:Uncharacterized protein n=1 Tax=Penicillium cataractarum TaxID=2100454 RepID=A0A9W9VDP5_9EURO|nr:uncharacterized protein N7496_005747 [Penicillium cataractarum]KAJ5378338.1 hypothetical protein N7496_005747 [Penicillium cataractarum]
MYGALTIQSKDLLLTKPEIPFPNVNYKSLVQRMTDFRSPECCPGSSFASIFGALEGSLEGLELDQFNSP